MAGSSDAKHTYRAGAITFPGGGVTRKQHLNVMHQPNMTSGDNGEISQQLSPECIVLLDPLLWISHWTLNCADSVRFLRRL